MVESRSIRPSLDFERLLRDEGHTIIAGVDEVGRGSWAGPLVAAAVVLPDRDDLPDILAGVRDSKQIPSAEREQLYEVVIHSSLAVGIGWSSHHVIDSLGLAAANRRAMLRAVRNLALRPDALLVDHFRLRETDIPQLCITRGDATSLSIAAASIVAKVVRDSWMAGCEARFPGYGFARHKGYGTPQHVDALEELGPSPLHRRSFAPVAVWAL